MPIKLIDKKTKTKLKKQLRKRPVIVDVNLEDDKFIFSIGSGEMIKKATIPAKDVHSYLRKPNEKIVAEFLKIWSVIVNPKKLKKKIKTLLPQIPIIETVALHEENIIAEQVGNDIFFM